MRIIKTLNITFFFIFMIFFTANAQNALNTTDIDNYLTSLNNISSIIKRYNDENRSKESADLATLPPIDALSKTPITDTLEFVKSHPTYSTLEIIVKSSGFNTTEEWANTGDQIMLAYSAYYLKNPQDKDAMSIEEMIKDLNAKDDQIKNNIFISDEQKNFLTEKIENSIAMLKDPNYIDNENIKTLSPYIKRLNILFKEQ
jgi:hypothetical protein